METTYLVNGRVLTDGAFRPLTLALNGGVLRLLPPDAPLPGGRTVDLAGRRVLPGFLDIHTHGAVHVDVNAATADELEAVGCFFASHGVTGWLASVLTDSEEQTRRCIDQYLAYRSKPRRGARLLGIHLEGPFLAPAYKGAMPEHLLRAPDLELLRSYQCQAQGGIRYITLSPEVEGVPELIPALRELGMTAAIGHSGADYETSMDAIRAGAAAATHTFNAMALLHQHRPAILGAVLESDVYCEMICDGRHLHPGIVRLLLKVKGPHRVVAITDSIMAAGLPDGNYRLGVNDVVVEDGDAKLPDGTRAGSTLTLDRALVNLLAFTCRPLEELAAALTENPARLIGLFDRKGSIADGKDADLVVLSENNTVEQVYIAGELFR